MNNTTSGGIGALGLLGIVFIVLKLQGVIDWSWWWVLVPFWGPFALLPAIGVVALVGYILFLAWVAMFGDRKRTH